jgi:hypothetical protein
VWMSLVHGSRGLIYFVHQFKPRFNEHALLDDPPMLAAVTALNRQIRDLAPVLNGPTVAGAVSARSSDPETPVDVLVKRRGDATYVFAVGMRNRPATATFTLGQGVKARRAVLLDGSRSFPIRDGKWEDAFGPYGVRLYRLEP